MAKKSKGCDPNTLNGPHPRLIHRKRQKFAHRRMRNAEVTTTEGEEIRIPVWRSEIQSDYYPDEREIAEQEDPFDKATPKFNSKIRKSTLERERIVERKNGPDLSLSQSEGLI